MIEDEYLFIGGSHDGMRHHVDEPCPIVCLVKNEPPHTGFLDPMTLSYELERYKRMEFRSGKTTMIIYKLYEMSDDAVLIDLISKYPNPMDKHKNGLRRRS